MSDVFFAADLHLRHKNILNFSRGQFSSIDEHDETLIENWNKTVRPQDSVWLMGDVSMGNGATRFIKRLNGNLNLIIGNHDQFRPETQQDLFKCVKLDKKFGMPDADLKGSRFLVSHRPIHPVELEFDIVVNVHGHTHAKHVGYERLIHRMEEDFYDKIDPRYLNISIENTDMSPVPKEMLQDWVRLRLQWMEENEDE